MWFPLKQASISTRSSASALKSNGSILTNRLVRVREWLSTHESHKSIKGNADSILYSLCGVPLSRTHHHVVCRWICPSFSTSIPNSEKIPEWKISNRLHSLIHFSRLKRELILLNLLTRNRWHSLHLFPFLFFFFCCCCSFLSSCVSPLVEIHLIISRIL